MLEEENGVGLSGQGGPQEPLASRGAGSVRQPAAALVAPTCPSRQSGGQSTRAVRIGSNPVLRCSAGVVDDEPCRQHQGLHRLFGRRLFQEPVVVVM
eukprot:9469252-Pyramimonas_sp.AAC.1